MKTISKKVFIYIFVGLLTFTFTSTSYYKSVHAMEWAAGAIAFEEAIKWLLAAIGVVSVGGMSADYWENHGDDFVAYCESQNIQQNEIAEWQLKACEGILDKGSECWTAFKNWAVSLISSSGSGSTSPTLTAPATANDIIHEFGRVGGFSVNNTISNNGSYYAAYMPSISSNSIYLIPLDDTFTLNGNILSWSSGATIYVSQFWDRYHEGNWRLNGSNGYSGSTSININNGILWGINAVGDYPGTIILGDVVDDPANDDFVSVPNIDIPNIDIISSDVPDEENPEVYIPYPGLDVSDDSISSDTYDDIIGAINDGTITINDGIDDIIGRLKVISYDTETGDVIPPKPDPDDPTQNIKKDDVVSDNKNNMGFTLGGLESVFPFCIPWDIYAFMNLLVAEPVAPEFDFPIKSVNNHTENIHVDLEPFEPVAVVVRYIFDFLFIIGLGMLTRSMIGGGSSD